MIQDEACSHTQSTVNRPDVFLYLDIGRDLVKKRIVLQTKRQV